MNVNFSNPFNGRKWLRLLRPSLEFGMSFDKDVSLKKEHLGFSFSSNNFGLRGPNYVDATSVICGTSFAMGLSVNDGDNWYDLISDESKFFNIGFPVGTENHNNRIETLYKGSFNKLIYIYHPNNWIISYNFYLAKKHNKNIFEYMKWKTSWLDTLRLYPKWLMKKTVKRLSGKEIYYNNNNKKYLINNRYSLIDLSNKKEFISHETQQINRLFSSFQQVKLIRVPIKEQVVNTKIVNKDLKNLNDNYDENYQLFINSIEHKDIELIDLSSAFGIEDFYPYDTHWNSNGNKKFFKLISNFLEE